MTFLFRIVILCTLHTQKPSMYYLSITRGWYKMQGSPDARLRLACCTSQVKRWSKAMEMYHPLSHLLPEAFHHGVATKFCPNFYLCSIRKKTFYQKWSSYKFLCKHKNFLTGVYMIFKYSKQFRFAPSFNKGHMLSGG